MAPGSFEVVRRGVFLKDLAKTICRGLVKEPDSFSSAGCGCPRGLAGSLNCNLLFPRPTSDGARGALPALASMLAVERAR